MGSVIRRGGTVCLLALVLIAGSAATCCKVGTDSDAKHGSAPQELALVTAPCALYCHGPRLRVQTANGSAAQAADSDFQLRQ